MIKCILVDDEAKALKMLQKKLENNFPELEITATFQNPVQALDEINRQPPDLVFLDIAMPNLSGFDLLSKIENPDFEIIFVTAYDSYAIEAIKHAAIGYIVKPIDFNELKTAVNKAKENIEKKLALQKNRALIQLLTQQSAVISIPTQEGYKFVKTEKILRLEGEGGYTKIICADNNEYLSSYNLGKFMEILNKGHFFQAHRSHIINLKYVTGYLNEGYIELSDSKSVPLSKNKRKEFLSLMGKIH